MPMLNFFKLFLIPNSFNSKKYFLGFSLLGGIHINPIMLRFRSFKHQLIKSFASNVDIPDFCFSFPMLTCIKKFFVKDSFVCCFFVLCTCEILSVTRDLIFAPQDDFATLNLGVRGVAKLREEHAQLMGLFFRTTRSRTGVASDGWSRSLLSQALMAALWRAILGVSDCWSWSGLYYRRR